MNVLGGQDLHSASLIVYEGGLWPAIRIILYYYVSKCAA